MRFALLLLTAAVLLTSCGKDEIINQPGECRLLKIITPFGDRTFTFDNGLRVITATQANTKDSLVYVSGAIVEQHLYRDNIYQGYNEITYDHSLGKPVLVQNYVSAGASYQAMGRNEYVYTGTNLITINFYADSASTDITGYLLLTLDAEGSVVTMDQYEMLNGAYEQIAKVEYEYDAHIYPLLSTKFAPYSVHNVTRETSYNYESGVQQAPSIVTYEYEYNEAGFPTQQTQRSNGDVYVYNYEYDCV